ncbi:hypothetical protein D0T25_20640 [Duganella sp. BJB488]|nr:hypothetical protein D0T26_17015 [Duganella sp. BJB489]RFP17986.1 hypothetical protein D0T25_20640 [Duganella sp. BJB488]
MNLFIIKIRKDEANEQRACPRRFTGLEVILFQLIADIIHECLKFVADFGAVILLVDLRHQFQHRFSTLHHKLLMMAGGSDAEFLNGKHRLFDTEHL